MKVIYEEQQGKLLKYKIEGIEDFLTIVTTRPGNYF
jgi:valyl-tRNA synthetase